MRRFPAAVLRLAALALPLPAAAQAWNSDAALALARRAIARRSGAARDTALHDYKAQAHGFLFFLGAFGEGLADPTRLIKAAQLELEVYWRAPARRQQRGIGGRGPAALPPPSTYHRHHPAPHQNDFRPPDWL